MGGAALSAMRILRPIHSIADWPWRATASTRMQVEAFRHGDEPHCCASKAASFKVAGLTRDRFDEVWKLGAFLLEGRGQRAGGTAGVFHAHSGAAASAG